MRQRMWRRLFAVAAAVVALGGAASAQAPVAYPSPRAFVMSGPGPAPVDYRTTAPADGVTQASGCAGGGCSAGVMATVRDRLGLDGPGCANPAGCGNKCTERTFFFGSCCQFFGHGRDCGGCGARGRCPGTYYGPGPCNGMNPCVYDSYANH